MRNTSIIILVIALVALPLAMSVAAGVATSVTLSANPNSIIADGKSVTTISVVIRDNSGNPVEDGTLVTLSTDLGTIPSTVETVRGVARGRLTSGTTVGTANVTAWVTNGGAIGKLRVEMLEPGTTLSRESFVTITSPDYLAYDSDRKIIYGAGKVKINHRGLAFLADEAQIDISAGTLKCRMASGGEPIVLSRGDKSIRASLLVYKLSESRGQAMVDGEDGKVHKVSFRGSDLATEPNDEYVPTNYFDLADMSETPMLVLASSMIYRPGEDLRIRRAKFFVDGDKMLSMPLYVVPLSGVNSQTSRYIGWGTSGIRLDLPYFYSLTANSTGSLRLRRGQQAGWGYYSANQGWSLDMVQDYTSESGADGGVNLNLITSGDWGAQWHHNQEFANGGQVYSFLDFRSLDNTYATTSISLPVGRLNVGANISANRGTFEAASSTSTSGAITPTNSATGLGTNSDFFIQTDSKPIAGGAANYVLRATTAFATGINKDTATSGSKLQMQLTGKRIELAKNTGLNTSLTVGDSWGSRNSGLSVLGTASLMHNLGQKGGVGLSYSFTSDVGDQGLYGRHRLSGAVYYTPSNRWQANINGTYTLDKVNTSSFADISYKLTPSWRLSLIETLQRFDESSYSETEIALGKSISGHEAAVVWSKSKKKFRVEFSAARF